MIINTYDGIRFDLSISSLLGLINYKKKNEFNEENHCESLRMYVMKFRYKRLTSLIY